jgi:hypothetical protein
VPRLSKAEQEVVIRKCADEPEWTIYSTDPKWTRFFTKLAVKVGGRVIEHQGGTKIFLSANSLGFSAKRKLRLTPEQRARVTQNLPAQRRTRAQAAQAA